MLEVSFPDLLELELLLQLWPEPNCSEGMPQRPQRLIDSALCQNHPYLNVRSCISLLDVAENPMEVDKLIADTS
jgi:hypothetical protein